MTRRSPRLSPFLPLLPALLIGCGGSGGAAPAPVAPGFYRVEARGSGPSGAFSATGAVLQIAENGAYGLFSIRENGAPNLALTSGAAPSSASERPARLELSGSVFVGVARLSGGALRYEASGVSLTGKLTPMTPPAPIGAFVLRDGAYSGESYVLDGDGTLASYGRASGTVSAGGFDGESGSVLYSARLDAGGATSEAMVFVGGSLDGSLGATAWSGDGARLVLRLENVAAAPTTTFLVLRRTGEAGPGVRR